MRARSYGAKEQRLDSSPALPTGCVDSKVAATGRSRPTKQNASERQGKCVHPGRCHVVLVGLRAPQISVPFSLSATPLKTPARVPNLRLAAFFSQNVQAFIGDGPFPKSCPQLLQPVYTDLYVFGESMGYGYLMQISGAA
ncbi:hypothetical protein H920_09642 [Fukomys damarensis]|uniref:Uncharacterized protein n=1 Tax=Fukomys damarensis TaxID=885580 RepID=A0A091DD36_FUKDA|nr:hypothetical protein H920_09642 [Fukomys damarensis]